MFSLAILSYGLAPVIALLLLVYLKTRLKIETNKFLYQAFLLGLISVVIVVLGQLLMDATGINYLKNIKRTAFYAMVIIAFSSELGKFIILRYVFLVKKTFYGPVDGIIYGIFIGLGFATASTILLGFGVLSSEVDYLYVFSNAPANIIFAVIMGFFCRTW